MLSARSYDAVLSVAERAALRRWRSDLLAHARGVVLEIGAGTGASLPFYPPAVERLLLLEPDPAMLARLVQRASWNGTCLPAAPGGCRWPRAASTRWSARWCCCSVGEPSSTVAELRRVLRPDGQLLLLEHVAGRGGSATRAAQLLLTPVWSRIAGGCSLERDTRQALADGGFDTSDLHDDRLPVPLPVVRPFLRGRAGVAARAVPTAPARP